VNDLFRQEMTVWTIENSDDFVSLLSRNANKKSWLLYRPTLCESFVYVVFVSMKFPLSAAGSALAVRLSGSEVIRGLI